MEKKTKFEKALNVIRKKIKEDPELYHAYQSNIAKAFYDEYYRISTRKYKNACMMYDVANKAAKNFLNLWFNS